MKKILLLALAALILPRPALCATDAKTRQLLEDLNRKYYCLMREGLKGFTCEAALARTENLKNQLRVKKTDEKRSEAVDGLKFAVSVAEDGALTVESVLPPPSGDTSFDAQLKKAAAGYKEFVEAALISWKEVVFMPLHDKKSYEGNWKIQDTSRGFNAIDEENGSVFTEVYDGDSKFLGCSEKRGRLETFHTECEYSKTPRGYLLRGNKMFCPTGVSSFKFEYRYAGDFWVLKKAEIRVLPKGAKKEIEAAILFTGYRLSQ
jgi:hypothetical protein